MNYAKRPTYRSASWLRAVASLPCVKCGREGQTQAAHRNVSKGMGIKTDDCLTAALCASCHSEVDHGKGMTRDERREVLDFAILMTVVELARAGKVTPSG